MTHRETKKEKKLDNKKSAKPMVKQAEEMEKSKSKGTINTSK